MLASAVLGWSHLSVLSGRSGPDQVGVDASPWDVARSVLIFPAVSAASAAAIVRARR